MFTVPESAAGIKKKQREGKLLDYGLRRLPGRFRTASGALFSVSTDEIFSFGLTRYKMVRTQPNTVMGSILPNNSQLHHFPQYCVPKAHDFVNLLGNNLLDNSKQRRVRQAQFLAISI